MPENPYEVLKFSENYNNKLDCDYFTMLTLASKKYQVGKVFDVELKKKHKKFAKVIELKYLKIEEISEYIAGLDTGYDAKTTKQHLREMYKNIVQDWEKTRLVFVLLKTAN